MNFALGLSVIFLVAALILNLRSFARGPSLFGRLIVSDVISGILVGFLLIGFRLHKQMYFLELAVVLAAISWIAIIGVVRFGRS